MSLLLITVITSATDAPELPINGVDCCDILPPPENIPAPFLPKYKLAFFCPSPYLLPAILVLFPVILTSAGLALLNIPKSVLPCIGILGTKLGSSICSWFNGP
jgi:hypothetical protein